MNGRPLQLFLFQGNDLLIVDASAQNSQWNLQRAERIADYQTTPRDQLASIIRSQTADRRKDTQQTRHTVLVIERSDLAVLNLTFPAGSADETQAMLELELDHQLPLDMNKICYGYHKHTDGEQDHIQVFWSPFERIQPRMDCLKLVGIEIEEIYPALPFYYDLIQDPDANHPSTYVLVRSNCVELVNWSNPRIIGLSRQITLNDSADEQSFCAELGRTIDSFFDHAAQDDKPAFIASEQNTGAVRNAFASRGLLLDGHKANLKWMGDIQDEDAFAFLPVIAVLNGIPIETPANGSVSETQTLNMLPRSIEEQRRRHRIRKSMIQVGGLLVIAIALVMANLLLYVNRLQTQIDYNTGEIQRLTPEARQVEAMEERIASIRRQINYVITPVDALGTINEILSTQASRLDGLFLDHFDYTESGLISLEGHATNDITPWSFAEALDKSGRFRITKKPRIERKPYGETRAIRFQLSCQALSAPSTKGAKPE
ncbi:MAG: hypothetical protein ABFD69_10460 [Candidatus Sumerlaeia bacterium]